MTEEVSSPLLPAPLNAEFNAELVVDDEEEDAGLLLDDIPELLSKGLNTEAKELLTGGLTLELAVGIGKLTVEVGR